MKHQAILAILIIALGFVVVEASAAEIHWPPGAFSPRMDEPPLEGEGLPRGRLIARVDSLEALLGEVDGVASAQLCYEIAEAYLATDLIKHHMVALEHLQRAQDLDAEYFDAGRLSAATVHAMRYYSQARKSYEQLCVDYPDLASSWYLLGGFHFTEARRSMEKERFHSAASAFSRAVAVDSTHVGARMGLSSSLAALNWYEDVPAVLDPIVGDPQHGREARFLRACAYTALEREEEAWDDFHIALEGADEDLRAVFVYGDGFLEESSLLENLATRLDPALLAAGMRNVERGWQPKDGLDAEIALRDSTVLREAAQSFWRSRNPNPTHQTNLHKMAYWQRLIEAEMLFGFPKEGVRGWDRETGQAWVRFGRPDAAVYMAGGFGGRTDDLAPFRLDYGIALPDPGVPVWVWAYEFGPYRFTLLFTSGGMNERWVGYTDTVRRLRRAEKQIPVVFEEDYDEEPSLNLEFSVAAFHRPQGATTLETYLLIETLESNRLGLPPPSMEGEKGDYVLEWAVFDENERRIDYRRYSVGDAQKESALRKALGRPPRDSDTDPHLMILAADLEPGEYRLALDVTSMLDGYHEARELALLIQERRIQTLGLSDLQLASIFEPWEGYGELPSGILKHAFAVVPAPGGIYPHDARHLYVYYEAYNLCRDERGETHFDVSYKVYRRKDKDRRRVVTRRDVAGLDPVDPLSLTYLEETTGTSPQQHVVKGGVVELESLEPGNYVLAVSISDRHCGLRAESFAAFTKSRPPRTP